MTIQDNFRTAMRNYIYSVSVMSMMDTDGTPYAITVSSVTSISMEPPSLLVCINKSARVHDSIKEGSDLCINLLTKDQEEISNTCSSESQFDKRFDDKLEYAKYSLFRECSSEYFL
jgi:flavin reductase